MSLFEKYPYTNFHEMNLDWIIRMIKLLDREVDDFVAYNKITFRGTWSGEPYPQWSVVDNGAGDAYLAIKPVPANVPLTDDEYWTKIESYSDIYTAFNSRISALETGLTNVNNRVNQLYETHYDYATNAGLTFNFIKIGNVCQMYTSGTATEDIPAGNSIVTIPATFRPLVNFDIWDDYREARVHINADGSITSSTTFTTGSVAILAATYIVAST